MQRFFSFLGGIALGGLVAGALGLLFAPRPGVETRRYLAERGEEIKERAGEMGERAQSMSQRLRSQSEQYGSEASHRTMQ